MGIMEILNENGIQDVHCQNPRGLLSIDVPLHSLLISSVQKKSGVALDRFYKVELDLFCTRKAAREI